MTASIPAPTTDGAQPMALVRVPDGQGGFRHEFRPVSAEPPKRKRKAPPKLDPIEANPEASAQQLKLIVERLERLNEEELGIKEDKRDVLAEAKAIGFDTKTLNTILALRKMDPNLRREAEALLETYKTALGLA